MSAAIVVAAGVGRRMGAGVNKVLLPLGDKPLLAHSLEILDASSRIDRVVVVTRAEDMGAVQSLVAERGVRKAIGQIVLGGAERFDSVLAGLNFLAQDPPAHGRPFDPSTGSGQRKLRTPPEAVLIHDAARPFLTHRMIEDTLAALDRWVGAIVGVPSRDTVKEVDDQHAIVTTLDRTRLWMAQTPQTFRFEPLLEAYRNYQPPPYPTDDAFLLERRGERLLTVEGSHDNIKITTSEDLHVAEALLQRRNP